MSFVKSIFSTNFCEVNHKILAFLVIFSKAFQVVVLDILSKTTFHATFVKNRLAYNEDLVHLWSSNLDVLTGICIVNKDLSLNLMNIRFDIFLIQYKSTYFADKYPKVLNILFISSLRLFQNKCASRVFYRKSIL